MMMPREDLGRGKNIPGRGNTYFKGPKMEGKLKLSRYGEKRKKKKTWQEQGEGEDERQDGSERRAEARSHMVLKTQSESFNLP